MLTYAIDKLEGHDGFIEFLKDNRFLTPEAYDRIQERKKREDGKHV